MTSIQSIFGTECFFDAFSMVFFDLHRYVIYGATMSDTFIEFKNIRTLKNACDSITLAQIEAMQNKLATIITQRKEEEATRAAEEQQKQAAIEKMLSELNASGIDVDTLVDALKAENKPARKPRAPRPAKYEYLDESGQKKQWTGQGRTPKSIQQQLDAGKSLEDFAI